MAQYKVPQNVEADDKLLGPFSFRQFIYLLVAAGGIALAVALFQIFPLLAIIPLPVVFFFGVLALPLKKDQPMETYIAALISFYTKPRIRKWMTGQRESTIQITAPKQVEASRTKDISEEEAGHRLSFLANIIDSGGQAIEQEIVDDAPDIFEQHNTVIDKQLNQSTTKNHAEALNQMRAAIQESETKVAQPTSPHNITPSAQVQTQQLQPQQTPQPVVQPTVQPTVQSPQQPQQPQPKPQPQPEVQLENLAKNNSDLSVATIQKEADRRERKHKNEVYVSLH